MKIYQPKATRSLFEADVSLLEEVKLCGDDVTKVIINEQQHRELDSGVCTLDNTPMTSRINSRTVSHISLSKTDVL